MVLEIPHKSCSVKHILKLDIQVKGLSKEAKFHFAVSVKKLAPADRGRETITVAFVSPQAEEWQRFVAVFEGRQDEVDKFLKEAKG